MVGNPPYGFHQIHENYLKPYFREHLISSHGSYENYILFYEKSLKLLKKAGLHGFIIPVTWLTIPSAESLRKYILDNFNIKEICWLPVFVFENAKVNTLISIVKNVKINNTINIKIYDKLGFRSPPIENRFHQQSLFIEDSYTINIFIKEYDSLLIKKIKQSSLELKELAKPCSGYNPYEVGKGIKPSGGTHTKQTVKDKPYNSNNKISKEWKPEIIGRNLDRYHLEFNNRWIKYGPWLAAQRDPNNFVGKRILVQEITGGKEKRIVASYWEDELYYSRDVIPIKTDKEIIHPFYLLGIINSLLITWYHHKKSPKAKKGLFPKVLVSDLNKLPIYNIKIENNEEKEQHDKMISLVNQMLESQKEYHSAKTDTDKKVWKKKIDLLDRQIDNLVYELYELTPEEIKIVEESV